MTFPGLTNDERAALNRLASAILPADERDAGAEAVNAGARIADRVFNGVNAPVYRSGLIRADALSHEIFGRSVHQLNLAEVHELVGKLQEVANPFFKQLRMDVCAMYLSDPGVW